MAGKTYELERASLLPAVSPPAAAAPTLSAPMPGTGRFRSPIAAVIQRARLDPRSLTRDDVAQLHRSIGNAAVGRLLTGAAAPNRTGLPDGLKANVEARSGLPMDDVRVHYNSSRPAALRAHAYAQGTEIHIGPGQERHLPHEAWHVVQQKQGRVKAINYLSGVPLNTDIHLEEEAEREGANHTVSEHVEQRDQAPYSAYVFDSYGNRTIHPSVAQRVTNEEYMTEIGSIQKDTIQSEEFERIREYLEGENWLLEETTRDHCYTAIEGKYTKIEGWAKNNRDNLWGTPGEVQGDTIEEEDTRFVVYYSPKANLIDLIHELDHVKQMEALRDLTGSYMMSTWSAFNDDGEGGETLITKDDDARTDVRTAFLTDGVEEQRKRRQDFIDEASVHGFNISSISDQGNNILEYHTYMREYIRFRERKFTKEQCEAIDKMVIEYREKAEPYSMLSDEYDEYDPVLNACNEVERFSVLRERYEAAKISG